MILTETAPAAATPVTLQDFSAHLRLAHGFPDDGAEDALLDLYLRNAASAIERRSGLALIRRGFVLRLGAWNRHGHAVLPVGPVASITGFRFFRDDTAVDVAAGSWLLEAGTARQRVTGAIGGGLPEIPYGYTAELTFDAGFGPEAPDVPGDLRHAVMLLAADYYERRHEGGGRGIPLAVRDLLEPWRLVRI